MFCIMITRNSFLVVCGLVYDVDQAIDPVDVRPKMHHFNLVSRACLFLVKSIFQNIEISF